METWEEIDVRAESQVDESRGVMQVRVSHSTDERRDEQPTVLQHGERSVPDHVLDVVTETVRTCKVMGGRSRSVGGNKLVL